MSDYEHDGNIFTGYEDELREHREYRKYDYGYEHTDAFEAGMMQSDIDDEWAEEQEYSGYAPSRSPREPKQGQKKSGGTPSSDSSAKSKQGQKNGSYTPPSHSSKSPSMRRSWMAVFLIPSDSGLS